MADIFREVEEDLRRERIQTLWTRYGNWAIGLVLVILLGTAGFRFYDHWSTQKQAQAVDELITLLREGEGDRQAILPKLESLALNSGSAGAAALARMHQAGYLAEEGDLAAATEHLQAVAKDRALPIQLRDMAHLMQITLLLDQPEVGDAEITQALESFTGGMVWQPALAELRALHLARQGDYQASARAFSELQVNANAPYGQRQRAANFADFYGQMARRDGETDETSLPVIGE